MTVKEDGFLFEGKPFRSLSAIAMKVTGYKAISGTLFFGIAKRAEKPAEAASNARPSKAKAARKAKAK